MFIDVKRGNSTAHGQAFQHDYVDLRSDADARMKRRIDVHVVMLNRRTRSMAQYSSHGGTGDAYG